jgi:hypothetical protein
MEFQLNYCLKYKTVLDVVLEPHWGKIALTFYGGCFNYYSYYTEGLIIEMRLGSDDKLYVERVEILGIKSSLSETIESCISEIELLFAKYSNLNQQFYRYPIFVILQAMYVASVIGDTEASTIWKDYRLYMSKYHNSRIMFHNKDIVVTDSIDEVLRLITSIIDGTAAEEYYIEVPITRMKSARHMTSLN